MKRFLGSQVRVRGKHYVTIPRDKINVPLVPKEES